MSQFEIWRGCKSVRRNLGAFLGRADHCNDGPVVADSAACRSVAVVVAVVVRSDVRDDCDLVDDRIPQMAQGKLTTKFQTETLPDDGYQFTRAEHAGYRIRSGRDRAHARSGSSPAR